LVFIYKDGKHQKMPYSIIKHFNDYKGPFFPNVGVSNIKNKEWTPLIPEWVLIHPSFEGSGSYFGIRVYGGSSVNDEDPSHSRKQFYRFSLGFDCMESPSNTIKGLKVLIR
jgi:hypothetical protein